MKNHLFHTPLLEFKDIQKSLALETLKRTEKLFSEADLDFLLAEELYGEKQRLLKAKNNLFFMRKNAFDKKLWNQVAVNLIDHKSDKKDLLTQVIQHYGEEIGGYFNPKIYQLATQVVPWFFHLLLNTANFHNFFSWKKLSLRLSMVGETEQLQKLASLGTVILVPTHQSNLDSLVLGYVIHLLSLPPCAYGAGLNLFNNPILGFFMRQLGAFTVDREKKNQIYKKTLKNYSSSLLQRGIHMLFFPGGSRSRSGEIEKKLKLGLLGTALDAQIELFLNHQMNQKIFIVPIVLSYHFVLEAKSLIENFLIKEGEHLFFYQKDESKSIIQTLRFFWKFFASESAITIRIGRGLDVFGNLVDERGHSIGPNNTTISLPKWVTSEGRIQHCPQRDFEYTNELGKTIVSRFHQENTVFTSHLIAFAFFHELKKKYPHFDLFRFLRLSPSQRILTYSDFLVNADRLYQKIHQLAHAGKLFLSDSLKELKSPEWVTDGILHLGVLHPFKILKF